MVRPAGGDRGASAGKSAFSGLCCGMVAWYAPAGMGPAGCKTVWKGALFWFIHSCFHPVNYRQQSLVGSGLEAPALIAATLKSRNCCGAVSTALGISGPRPRPTPPGFQDPLRPHPAIGVYPLPGQDSALAFLITGAEAGPEALARTVKW